MSDNLQAVIDAVRAGQPQVTIAVNRSILHVFIPGFGDHGSRIESVNLEAGEPAPFRKRGTITVFDVDSLNQIIADNADGNHITVYVNRDPENPQIIAVLNGNGPNAPGWGDLSARVEFRCTPQWLKWKAYDGKLLGQTEFAEFIEDNMDDIASPPGAEMLEIAQYLQATRTVNFKSGIRLSSGQIQFQNVEDIQAQVKAGEVAVPEAFSLGIAPLFGCPSYEVPVRFRYRVQDGKLRLGYKLQRVETMMGKILDEAVGKMELGEHAHIVHGLAPAATK